MFKRSTLVLIPVVFILLTFAGCKDLNGGVVDNDPVELTENVWVDSQMIKIGGTNIYYFDVEERTEYFIWWNDDIWGDETKDLNIKLTADYKDGENIFAEERHLGYLFDDFDDPIEILDDYDCWEDSFRSFIAEEDGVVEIKVQSFWGGLVGSYGIVFSTSDAMPGFFKGTVSADFNVIDYGIPAEPSEVIINAYSDSDLSQLVKNSEVKEGKWNMFLKNTNPTVLYFEIEAGFIFGSVKKDLDNSWTAGSSAIINFGSITVDVEYPEALAHNEWKNGEINDPLGEDWYSLQVNSALTYYFYLDETKTLDVEVDGFLDENDILFYFDEDGQTFEPEENCVILLRVRAKERGGATGTYAIKYSNTAP
ncbi:MAG: hypothetical protein FWD26_00950 [Treponema sp.]|nr:hypothetical protein [Treponema sp.]